MSDHTYKFNVTMSCGGCSGAINRVLGKLEGELRNIPMPLTQTMYPPFHPR